jgi:hypothetical protein
VTLADVEIAVRVQPDAARGLRIGQSLAVRPHWGSALAFDDRGLRAHGDGLRAAA